MKRKESINQVVVRRIKNISPQLNKDFGVSKIGIFGSYSRGEEKRNSDINRPVNLFEFSRLKLFLSEQLGIQVDLVTAGALKPLIKDKILASVSYV